MPAGLRQKDQTKKAPTGTFQRDNLLAHLEKQAKEHPDKEDLVPFTGEKRGKHKKVALCHSKHDIQYYPYIWEVRAEKVGSLMGYHGKIIVSNACSNIMLNAEV